MKLKIAFKLKLILLKKFETLKNLGKIKGYFGNFPSF